MGGEANDGVLSMRMQVILDSLFFSLAGFNPHIERRRKSSENGLESNSRHPLISNDTHSLDVILSIHFLVL